MQNTMIHTTKYKYLVISLKFSQQIWHALHNIIYTISELLYYYTAPFGIIFYTYCYTILHFTIFDANTSIGFNTFLFILSYNSILCIFFFNFIIILNFEQYFFFHLNFVLNVNHSFSQNITL